MSRSVLLLLGFVERNGTMQLVSPDSFLAHLTLTLDWMTVSLGLWGYSRVINLAMHESSFRGVQTTFVRPGREAY
jgi:hypothetical protein